MNEELFLEYVDVIKEVHHVLRQCKTSVKDCIISPTNTLAFRIGPNTYLQSFNVNDIRIIFGDPRTDDITAQIPLALDDLIELCKDLRTAHFLVTLFSNYLPDIAQYQTKKYGIKFIPLSD